MGVYIYIYPKQLADNQAGFWHGLAIIIFLRWAGSGPGPGAGGRDREGGGNPGREEKETNYLGSTGQVLGQGPEIASFASKRNTSPGRIQPQAPRLENIFSALGQVRGRDPGPGSGGFRWCPSRPAGATHGGWVDTLWVVGRRDIYGVTLVAVGAVAGAGAGAGAGTAAGKLKNTWESRLVI